MTSVIVAGRAPFHARSRTFWIAAITFAWLAATWLFWLGYSGDDDFFYARYAYLFHRPPFKWWEFRIPAILAIRGAFLAFGPTELAAALPSLLASLAIMGSVAWLVNWPRAGTWQSHASMLVAAVIPIDVAFRSWPSANQISAGLLALGTVGILKGTTRTQLIGSALLAIGFLAHENSFFYVALFCLTALAFDARRYWRPVAACVVCSGLLVGFESLTYQRLLGDPFARFKTAAGATSSLTGGADAATELGFGFLAWPIQTLIISKQFGFDLILLLVAGSLAWRGLSREQRILLVTTFAVFLWFGYGTVVPWAYKPLYRQFHYYNCLTLGVAALLPHALSGAFAHRERLAQGVVGLVVVFHVLTLSITGRYGADVDVSRTLLRYAQQHPAQTFLVDVNTMNQLYALNGFQLPANVVCLNGPAVELHLLLNKEPPGSPLFRFPEVPVDTVLLNLEQQQVRGFEREFLNYLKRHAGPRRVVAPVKYRLPFVPLVQVMEPRGFMIRSAGAEAVSVQERASASASRQ